MEGSQGAGAGLMDGLVTAALMPGTRCSLVCGWAHVLWGQRPGSTTCVDWNRPLRTRAQDLLSCQMGLRTHLSGTGDQTGMLCRGSWLRGQC